MTVSRKTEVTVSGNAFLSMLLLLFIGLKLAGVITWSWWWVLAPFWVPLALVLIVVGGTFAYLRWVAKP